MLTKVLMSLFSILGIRNFSVVCSSWAKSWTGYSQGSGSKRMRLAVGDTMLRQVSLEFSILASIDERSKSTSCLLHEPACGCAPTSCKIYSTTPPSSQPPLNPLNTVFHQQSQECVVSDAMIPSNGMDNIEKGDLEQRGMEWHCMCCLCM